MSEYIIQKKTKCDLPGCDDGWVKQRMVLPRDRRHTNKVYCPRCKGTGYVYEEVPLVEALLDSAFIEDWKLRSSRRTSRSTPPLYAPISPMKHCLRYCYTCRQ